MPTGRLPLCSNAGRLMIDLEPPLNWQSRRPDGRFNETTFPATFAMFYGTIKRIEPDRGFGFIETGGRDVYFHAVDIGDEVFQRLQPGQPVTFEYAPRQRDVEPEERKGPRAVKLKLIERMPGGVLPRTPQELAPK